MLSELAKNIEPPAKFVEGFVDEVAVRLSSERF